MIVYCKFSIHGHSHSVVLNLVSIADRKSIVSLIVVTVPYQKQSVFARVKEPLSLYSAYIPMKPSVILIKTKINNSFQLRIDNLSCTLE